jgi:hypothetical protein
MSVSVFTSTDWSTAVHMYIVALQVFSSYKVKQLLTLPIRQIQVVSNSYCTVPHIYVTYSSGVHYSTYVL